MKTKVSILGKQSTVRELLVELVSKKFKKPYVVLPMDFGMSVRHLIDHDSDYDYAIFVGELNWTDVRYTVKKGLKVMITKPNVVIPKDLIGKVITVKFEVEKVNNVEKELQNFLLAA